MVIHKKLWEANTVLVWYERQLHSILRSIRLDEYSKPALGFQAHLTLTHQSHDSCPMDRFDESFYSCPMDGSDESNHLCSIDRTRPVLISFPHYCRTKFTNRTDGVDSTVLGNPHPHSVFELIKFILSVSIWICKNPTEFFEFAPKL